MGRGVSAGGTLNPNAQFTNVDNAYIGMDFRINGGPDLYYGWIRVSVNNAAATFVIHDWAYVTDPGVGILAGDAGVVGSAGRFQCRWQGRCRRLRYLAQKSINTPEGYATWRSNYGNTQSGSGATIGASAIPEPVTLGLLAAGSAGLGLLRRRRKS